MHNPQTDLKQRTYRFSLDMIGFCRKLSSDYCSRIICNQSIRSATSIGANIIEAKYSASKKEFAKFYRISLRSANETIYWLSLIKDSKIASEVSEIDKLMKEVDELCRVLAKSLLTLRK